MSSDVAARPSFQIRDAVADTWRAQFEHPFVLGLADGALPAERFAFFLRQDYGYLREYSRFLLLAAAPATDLAEMRRFTGLAQLTLNVEMATLRGLAAGVGVAAAELDAVALAPTARAYTDFLVRTAYAGQFVELVAAMLPCYWAYTDIGAHLLARPGGVAERYRPWIESYVDPAMVAEAEWCRLLLDRLVLAGGDAARAGATEAFRTSTEYELAFWEMAWRGR